MPGWIKRAGRAYWNWQTNQNRPPRKPTGVTATSNLPIRRENRIRALATAAPGTERIEMGTLPAIRVRMEEYREAGWEIMDQSNSKFFLSATANITVRFRKM